MFVSLLPANSGAVGLVGVVATLLLPSPEPLTLPPAVLLREEAEVVLARGRVWLPLPPLLFGVRRGTLSGLLLLLLPLLLLLGVGRGRVPF